ncbi:MAG: tRNA (adenosine(37)-N6)-dimethylallyltransferase MiaA [Phycisphaerales bacterium]|jgi:tRNA dimethylallyltransferase|nr:tRNA (adenosine(37)-N6)-dimethylallyltransferase MiaA [Phycisphaerales bacterium]
MTHSILTILGPTASGKSELALALARRRGAELLNVDSMQVYRGMDIGTAKASPAERSEIRHHLLDVVEPNESYTVARFVQDADQVIADCRERSVPLIAAGGTPLYYKSLFQGIFEGPGADESLRQRLREQNPTDLYQQLSQVDPAAAGRIHPNDSKRLIRALEVYELTGKPISSLQTHWQSEPKRHQTVWVGLTTDRDKLNRRINQRVKQMVESGWVDEVQRLLERYGTLSPTAAEAAGYTQIIDHLHGKSSLEEAIEQIKIQTRQLARRQIKWFRRFEGVLWLDVDEPLDQKVNRVLSVWSDLP